MTGIYEGEMLNGKMFPKGMWRVIRETSIAQMITRCFGQGEDADCQNKNNVTKRICFTERRLTEPLQITVVWLSKSEIGGRKSCWRKCISTGGKGICRSSWRKWMRCPRRLRVPSLNKIAQTAVRPSPLWEFRAANCFRDFIVAWQNENLRWLGLSYLSRITGIRRSVAKGFCVSAFCPLECKRIRLASLRWFSDEANY